MTLPVAKQKACLTSCRNWPSQQSPPCSSYCGQLSGTPQVPVARTPVTKPGMPLPQHWQRSKVRARHSAASALTHAAAHGHLLRHQSPPGHINQALQGVKAFYEWVDADIALTAHPALADGGPAAEPSEQQPSSAKPAATTEDTPDSDAGPVSYVQVIALAMPADALAYELEQLLHAKSRALEQRASLLEAAIADASAAKQLVAATKLGEYQAVEADNTAALNAQVAGLEHSAAALRAYVSHAMDEQLYQVPQAAEHVAEMRENIATFVQDARRAMPDSAATSAE